MSRGARAPVLNILWAVFFCARVLLVQLSYVGFESCFLDCADCHSSVCCVVVGIIYQVCAGLFCSITINSIVSLCVLLEVLCILLLCVLPVFGYKTRKTATRRNRKAGILYAVPPPMFRKVF